MARGAPRSEGGPPRFVNVYLDPPTARVLEVVDFRSSLIGLLHRFHENLTIPEYSGRAIVGWVGVGMLILSLTGIWLWWPRNGAFVPGLRWRRAPHTTNNLHHLLGFWISIPLAVVSFTGIYLGFPQTARQVMSSIAPMTPQGAATGFGAVARDARLTPETALAAALASQPGARPAVIFLPTASGNSAERDRARGAEQQTRGTEQRSSGENARGAGPIWRVQLRQGDSGEIVTVIVDDRSGAVERLPPARRRPRRAMDPLDPRGQPQRAGLAIRRVPDRRIPANICGDRRHHVVAGPAPARGRRGKARHQSKRTPGGRVDAAWQVCRRCRTISRSQSAASRAVSGAESDRRA